VREDIHLILHVTDMSYVVVQDEDLVILMTNLLDNAIEACQKTAVSNRKIWLNMEVEEHIFIVSTQNPYNQECEDIKDFFHTWKKDTWNHGIGLKNIHSVTEKYHGDDIIICRDGMFTHTVILEM
jgi:sensor histidine kinase regulating citrate/malate metabolism